MPLNDMQTNFHFLQKQWPTFFDRASRAEKLVRTDIRASLEKELGNKVDLVKFIISLTGLSKEKVNQVFADFINKHQLNSVQIEFLNTIKIFFTENGRLDVSKLYGDPFKRYHSLGVDGVFNENQADELFQIIDDINEIGEGA